MKELKEILALAEKDFPKEFKIMISCNTSKKHNWFINLLTKQNDVRLIDIECKNCKTNLAIALRLFAGVQDHG